jgi:hypothetical protein
MSLTGLNLYHAQLILRVSRRQKGKPESKNKPTNSAIHTSDADRRRKILMTTSKCTTNFKERWDQGGSLGKSGKSGTSAFFSGRCRYIKSCSKSSRLRKRTKIKLEPSI